MGNCDRVELLAPAGNAEGLYGAIHAGADAVYLGGSRFGARAYAENFTQEELVNGIRYAHLMGRRIYMTVNTLLKEREMEELEGYLRPFYEEELDAVIVQDLGVLRLVRERFPGLKIHASTQMTLCGVHGVSLLKELGASRVVPARELSLGEILLLKGRAGEGCLDPGRAAARRSEGEALQSQRGQASDMEIECFIHGAMCYCYSGQCLFSSILGGRSGNRGRCAQPCRLPYTLKPEGGKSGNRLESCHPLSLKDMCTIEHIPLLTEAGIDSFKIEGRMKKPEYAAGVTEVYRRYIDRYYELRERKGAEEAAEAYLVEKADWNRLHSLYIRSQVQDGYYFKRNGADMVTLDNPAYSGSDEELLSEIRDKYIGTPLKLPVKVKAEFRIGAPASLTLSVAGEEPCPEGKGRGRVGGISYTAIGAPVERAQRQPITEEDVAVRLGRLGDSGFYAREMELSVEESCFYPMGQVNELRRTAAAGLEEKILEAQGYGRSLGEGNGISGEKQPEKRESVNRACGSAVSVRTLEQLEALTVWLGRNPGCGPGRIYVDGDLLVWKREETLAFCRQLQDRCGTEEAEGSGAAEGICAAWELYAAMPYILRAEDEAYLGRLYRYTVESGVFSGFLVRSLDGLGYLSEREKKDPRIWKGREDGAEEYFGDGVRGSLERGSGRQMILRADAGVYVWNHLAKEELSSLVEGFCLPYELNAGEQRALLCAEGALRKGCPWEKVVYGRIPMMLTANCLQQTAGRCNHENGVPRMDHENGISRVVHENGMSRMVLQDRYRKEFPVVINCLHCMNIIYNSVPLSLWKELPKWKGKVDLRIDFTLETPEEVGRVLDSFLEGAAFREGEHTSGHEKRGVE